MREILLPLSEEEAVTVSVALWMTTVGLVHDEDSRERWRADAEAVGLRLLKLRAGDDE